MSERKLGWGVFEEEDGKHVVPFDDAEKHTLSRDCSCKPTAQLPPFDYIIVHHSFDCRELIEEAEVIKSEVSS